MYYRLVDELGRIVLPREIRDKVDIYVGDKVCMTISESRIVMTKAQDACVVCNRIDGLKRVKDKYICVDCCGGIER